MWWTIIILVTILSLVEKHFHTFQTLKMILDLGLFLFRQLWKTILPSFDLNIKYFKTSVVNGIG